MEYRRSREPALELKVLVININEGYNQKLMESCQILKEYAQYVSKVRTYKKTLSLNEAVEKAVEECIQEGILDRKSTRLNSSHRT